MLGAVFQLHSKGPQDSFLTGRPEFNFIKQVYKQYENFAIEQTKILSNETVNFGNVVTFDIKKIGDFLYKTHFSFTLPKLVKRSGTFAGYTNSIGHAIIEYVDIEIGGTRVDRNYGVFMEIWNELTTLASYSDTLIGKFAHTKLLKTNAVSDSEYKVPLQFWFNKNIGSSLPLLSLRSSSIKIILKLRPFSECIVYDGGIPPAPVNIKDCYLLSDYIFIDEVLKRNYIANEHLFLITQTQFNGDLHVGTGGVYKSNLAFNHPCSEIIFVLRETASEENNDYFNFSLRNFVINTEILPLLHSSKLILDGKDRTCILDQKTLGTLNTSKYHTNTTDKHIYTMPFCSDPEKSVPTGSLNFSTFTSAILYIKLMESIAPSNCFIFARNYNIITIKESKVRIHFSV